MAEIHDEGEGLTHYSRISLISQPFLKENSNGADPGFGMVSGRGWKGMKSIRNSFKID
ncbi:MAG: hypothetical protein JXB25_05295 [Deltaproteobacteria bacterium]|nr:hypothetical protein [Deltaproteobacteria bacterium]